jgi:magnesium transporter
VQVLEAIDPDEIARLRAAGQFFWLDLDSPTGAQIDELAEIFGLHPVAVEDTKEFGQRPKLDDYESFLHLVFYGLSRDESGDYGPVEVHVYVSGEAIVTLHHDGCEALYEAMRRAARAPDTAEEVVVYHVLDALTDSFFPALEQMDDAIDDIEDRMLEGPTDGERHELYHLKRELITLRRVVTPQRDMMASAADFFDRLPGFSTAETHDYFRDVYDHLIRISDVIDSYRDLLSGTLDLYLTTQSNRLNEIMRRLTVIATIFLPLSFVVGFFGQNFAWLTGHIQSFTSFLLWGIGSLVVSVAALMAYFKRGHFLDSSR